MEEKKTIELNEKNFDSEVLKSGIPVLVDFWAQWCGPCRFVAPIVEELAKEYENKIKVCKLNVDDNPSIAGKYRITGIPTLIIFKDGKVMEFIVGARPKGDFVNILNKFLNE